MFLKLPYSGKRRILVLNPNHPDIHTYTVQFGTVHYSSSIYCSTVAVLITIQQQYILQYTLVFTIVQLQLAVFSIVQQQQYLVQYSSSSIQYSTVAAVFSTDYSTASVFSKVQQQQYLVQYSSSIQYSTASVFRKVQQQQYLVQYSFSIQ